MKKYFLLYYAFFLLVSLLSCKKQEKREPLKQTIVKPKPLDALLLPADPYFTGTSVITSAYGPNNITRNVIQDRKENYWFATWEGIMGYNGNIFTNYTNKNELKRYRAFTILEDRAGDIWFGTVGAGVYRYDGKFFTNYSTAEGLVNDRIGCFLQDSEGSIWIGTADGISKFDGTTFTNFTTEDGLPDDDVNSIVEDNTGKLWIGTRGSASIYDGKSFSTLTNEESKTFQNVRTIIKDKNDNLWLGGNDGLWSYDGKSFTNYTKSFVGYIYEDKKGHIWTSSAGINQNWVLSKYDKYALNNIETVPNEIKVIDGMIFGITEDREGNIWFGTLNGVYRYDGKTFNDFKELPD